ncbi:MAG TPA: FHA domain-containing protein [Miltoncostaeaceae bacterium]|nr:FHA domain-containing protein [Miltoncostaeaceae bacterium]
MNETGLIIAEVAFLVLLYAFVWSIVRSSSRQLRTAQAPPPPPPAPPVAEDLPAAAPAAAPAPVATVPAAVVTPPEVVPPPLDGAPSPQGGEEPLFAAATNVPEAEERPAREGSGRIDLSANVEPRLVVETSPSLEVGRVIPLAEGITIGRSDAAELSIADQFVSHTHARIMRRGAYHWVQDLGSTNGTFLNDRRIDSDAQLKVHDVLRIGQTILRYQE